MAFNKIRSIRKNKKAFIASALVDFYSYIMFILVIIIFFALFNLRGCAGNPAMQEISSYSYSSVEGNEILIVYLRTPLSVDVNNDGIMDKVTFAELISYAVDNPRLRTKLERETREYLEKIKETLPDKNVAGWNMKIIVMPDDDEILDIIIYDVIAVSPVVTIEHNLPVRNRDKYVVIIMSKEMQGSY